jgi:hypothetical protein
MTENVENFAELVHEDPSRIIHALADIAVITHRLARDLNCCEVYSSTLDK